MFPRERLSAHQLALALPPWAWESVSWREGARGILTSLFTAVRVRPARRENRMGGRHPEEWLLIDWPRAQPQPAEYWLSNLPSRTPLAELVQQAKRRWIIQRDSHELKQEVGLAHCECRGWRGIHHHATLCIAAYGFLVAERNSFCPWARVGRLELPGL
jgi:SRSO17 transposase